MVALLFDVTLDSPHAVLFDKTETNFQNDGFYYFKDSQGPSKPSIAIPKNRGIFQHFHLLKKAVNGQFGNFTSHQMEQEFDKLVPGIELTMTSSPYWTVAELYSLSIESV